MKDSGYNVRRPTLGVVQKVMRKMDANYDGKVTYDEFQAWIKEFFVNVSRLR